MIVRPIEHKQIIKDLREGIVTIFDLFDISQLKFSKNGK